MKMCECEVCHKMYKSGSSPSEIECPECYEAMQRWLNDHPERLLVPIDVWKRSER